MKSRQEITATVFDRRGMILAVGKNSYKKTHPKQSDLAKKAGLPEKEYLHAEVAAIIKAIKRGKPYKIRVERYSNRVIPSMHIPAKFVNSQLKNLVSK